MGKTKKQQAQEEVTMEDVTHEEAQQTDSIEAQDTMRSDIQILVRELNRLRKDMEKQEINRKKEMDEFRASFQALSSSINSQGEWTTQGPNATGVDKGKGVLGGGPNLQVVNEVDHNVSHVGTSLDGSKLNKDNQEGSRLFLGPPKRPSNEIHGEQQRNSTRTPRFAHQSQDQTYYDSDGKEHESPPRRRREQRPEPRRASTARYDFPKFNGEGLRGWLFMAQKYFVCQHVPRDEWIEMAAANMTGDATEFCMWFDHKYREPTWEQFRASIQLCFGDSTFVDYDEDLKNLVQTTTIQAYQKQFERLASQVQWSDKALIGAFKGGLKPEIKIDMKTQRYTCLEECFAMARIFEERLGEKRALKKVHKIDKQKRKFSYPSVSRTRGNEVTPFQKVRNKDDRPKSGRNPPTRYLTPKQMEELRCKGLCFRCEEKWDKTHQCKSFLRLQLVEDSDTGSKSDSISSSSSSSEEEVEAKHTAKKEETPKTETKPEEAESLHSLTDPYKPNTMRVFGRINKHKVLILLDSGATKNFLTVEAATRCKAVIKPSKLLSVKVGDGYRLQSEHEGRDIEVVIKKKTFKIDLLVLPLDGVDFVLGMSWFFMLGVIAWDAKNF
ncbi:hypothetical protein EJ110_NYTH51645 [Nymphaea thermarum]|nr:hypothetical protein EJ110_NYTH51645 [Nymphaea thermarum]